MNSILLKLQSISLTYLGLQPITLLAFLALLVFDCLLDNIVNKSFSFKLILKSAFNIFAYLILLFIIFSLTHQFGIVFTSIFNSIFVIILLDYLINVFNTLSKITKESAFKEITLYFKEKLLKFKSDSKTETKEKTNGTTTQQGSTGATTE